MIPHFAVSAFLVVWAIGVLTWLLLQGSRKRVLATLTFAILAVCAFAANIESAGQPKPLLLEWRDIADEQIVGMDWDEGRRIVWLWVRHDGAPIAYVLPWPEDQKRMGELQDAWRRKGSTGDEFQVRMDGEVADVVPPQQMPEKSPN